MNKIFVNNIGDLAEAQRASFYRFLSFGISEEISRFPNPFLANLRIGGKKKVLSLVYLYPSEIKLKGSSFNSDTCLRRDLSYTIQIYIPSEYSYPFEKKAENNLLEKLKIIEQKVVPSFLSRLKFSRKDRLKHTVIKQDIFFGEIPLMTEEGTFIINGCERVIISQIIRSPGIYFKKEFGISIQKTKYTATLISNKGLWTKFILDTKPKKKIKKKDKSKEEETRDEEKDVDLDRIYIKLNEFRRKSSRSSQNEETKGFTKNDNENLFITEILQYFGLNIQEMLDSLKYSQYCSNSNYQFIPERTDLDPTYETSMVIKKLFLDDHTGCFSIGEIGRYKINQRLGLNLPKDVTYLTPHDFLGIMDGLFELKHHDRMNDDIDDIKGKLIRSIGELLQNQIRVGLYRLEQNLLNEPGSYNTQKLNFDFEAFEDPEEWILDPRPLTNSIRDFFKTSQLSQYMDQINPLAELTHKRRISVFGPNGLKRDHISTKIRDIHPSQYGRLCPIETPEGQNSGLIMAIAMLGRINSMGSIETPYFLMKQGKVYSTNSPIYLNPDQESLTKVAFCDVSMDKNQRIKQEYISVKENYIFSLKKLKEVEFLTTSPLQIISLATSLIPFLEHDDANRALMGSNMQRQAVPLLYTQKPIVGTGLEASSILDSGMVIKSYSEGEVIFSSGSGIQVEDFFKQSITYYLRKYYRSNQETSINQRPLVWPGEKVFSGQIIADGPSTNDGELSLGRNLIIAYMPWEGYNYEDAIVINERILFDDCLTSVHIEEYETNLTYCIAGNERLTKNLPHLTKYIRKHLTKDGIVKIGSYVKEHDILVGKLTPCEKEPSPETKLLKALYGKKEKNYRDTSLRVPQGTEGRVIDIRIISTILLNKDEPGFALSPSSEMIKISIAQIRKVQVGDKLAGRHGNKGIIARILPRQDMPYLPDGTPIDIVFNPLGVPSRMNVGQVFECLLGLAGERLGKRFKVTPFDEIYGQEASRILVNQKLKEAALVKNAKWLFNSYYPGKIMLRDGRTGEFFDNPITVGKSYILKLIHLVEDKIHARATGPYAMITEQPLGGKSQKGGQRFGEMEVWALEAYGCSHTLQELLTIKSDDVDGRNDMYESILIRKDMEKPTPSIPESFLTLMRELNSLGLDFSLNKIEGGFYSTTKIKKKEKDIFEEIESRLRLRALLSRQKAEFFSKSSRINNKAIVDKEVERLKILDTWKKIKNILD
jgi:DNA-directed RNA polymerase subunit beta